MKQLIVVRHAKSSWADSGLDDHERPLSKRGERDAPFMAKVFSQKKIEPDLIISSTAKRAVAAAKEFAVVLDYKKNKIVRTKELYLADLNELMEYIRAIDDENKTVMLFGHNPGLTLLVNYVGDFHIDNIPTCGVCAFSCDIEEWKNLNAQSGKLMFFEYPKKYFSDVSD